MAYVSNNCWGFRRADLQFGVTCSGSITLQTRPVRRSLKAQSSRLRSEYSSSSSSSNSRHCRHRHSLRKVSASAAGEKTKRGRTAPSSAQPPPPDDGTGRLKDFPFPPVIPGPQLDVPDPEGEYDEDEEEDADEDEDQEDGEIENENEEEDDDEEDPLEFPDDDIRAQGGYTPFEELDWSEEDITHELSIYVDAPRTKCFQMWQDRLNYLDWFDNIGQLIAHRQDPDLVSMFIFYQWASTPMLELYTTLSRSEVQEDEHILEESVDGMDFVAGVLFADAEGKSGTNVTLRLGYYLPEQLNEFVGAMPVYGDVNDILETSMSRMKEFIENIGLETLQTIREAARIQEEQELQQEAEEFHTEFGSDEEIYSKAQEAAAGYLAELGVEDEEEDEGEDEEPEREPTEEDWNDTPEYGPDEFTPVDDEALPDYLASVDLDDDVDEDPDSTSSELGSLQPETVAGEAEQAAAEPQQAAAASSRDQARATEQQAAADMSSMLQQDVGQFDEVQASRVSPESMLSVSPPEGTAPVPDQDRSRQQLGEEDVQQQSQRDMGQQSEGGPSPQVDQKAAKPKKKSGRPKKKDDSSAPKKKPGRRKKADTA